MRVVYRMYVNTLDKYDAVIVFSENQKRMLEKNGVERAQMQSFQTASIPRNSRPGESDYKTRIGRHAS